MKMASMEVTHINQVIKSFCSRCMQVILESRIPLFASSSSSSYFSVDSASCTEPGITEQMEPWSKGVWDPIIIDILYTEPPISDSTQTASNNFETSVLLERWTIQFSQLNLAGSGAHRKSAFYRSHSVDIGHRTKALNRTLSEDTGRGNAGNMVNAFSQHMDININILMRSLYCALRILPAQKLFKDLCTSSTCNYTLYYKMLTSSSDAPENVSNMVHHSFSPITSNFGHMYVSVLYDAVVPIPPTVKENPLLLSKIISDYVDNASTIQLQQTSSERWYDASTTVEDSKPIKQNNIDAEEIDCPFAIYDQRTESKMSGSLSGVVSVVKLLDSAAPLGGVHGKDQETFILYRNKKTTIDALKELNLYLKIRDSLN